MTAADNDPPRPASDDLLKSQLDGPFRELKIITLSGANGRAASVPAGVLPFRVSRARSTGTTVTRPTH